MGRDLRRKTSKSLQSRWNSLSIHGSLQNKSYNWKIGTMQDKRELKIEMLITANVRNDLAALLQEYVDVFALSYADMPGLDIKIIVHKLPLIEGCKSVKQKLRRARSDILVAHVRRRGEKIHSHMYIIYLSKMGRQEILIFYQ